MYCTEKIVRTVQKSNSESKNVYFYLCNTISNDPRIYYYKNYMKVIMNVLNVKKIKVGK